MKSNSLGRIRLTQILLGMAIVVALVVVRRTHAGKEPIHLPTDWSHRHLVFSPPQNLGQHIHLLSNPRYVQQLVRKNAGNHRDPDAGKWRHAPEDPNPLQGDWNVYLGISSSGTAGTVGAGNYPAKFSFDVSSANCADVAAPAQPDFVVYNTSLAGSATPLAARVTGTFGGVSATSSTITITNGGSTLTMSPGASNAHTGTGTGTYVASGNTTTEAGNFVTAMAISGNGSFPGVTASNSGAVVTLTASVAGTDGNAITVAASTSPASNLTWTFAHLVDGATGVPTIVAYDNLYSSCSGITPSTYWAYNTGTGSTVHTSPVLSGDGSQIAFVQYTGTLSQLVVLKWAANNGSLSAPVAPTSVAGATYRSGCTAPCITTINFSTANGGGNGDDAMSSPFYDYINDAIYVGDNVGMLHKFAGVFYGAPSEIVSTTGATRWPAAVGTTMLTSAIYDDNAGANGQIYISGTTEQTYRLDPAIGSGPGGIVASAIIGKSFVQDAPLVDSSTGNVYLFMKQDNNNSRAGVFRFPVLFASGSSGTETIVGTNSTYPLAFYAGTFDNIYYNSSDGTGNMYVCTTAGSAAPTLWRIPITAGALGTALQGPTLSTASATCSPVTEFNNGSTDRIFVSVTGSSSICAGAAGCITSYDVTTTADWGTVKTASASANVAGGASAAVVDGSSTIVGASQIYFTTLSTTAGNCITANQEGIGGCAIQASQSGLN